MFVGDDAVAVDPGDAGFAVEGGGGSVTAWMTISVVTERTTSAGGSGGMSASQSSRPHWHSKMVPVNSANMASELRWLRLRPSCAQTVSASAFTAFSAMRMFSAAMTPVISPVPSMKLSVHTPRLSRASRRRSRTASGS